MCIWLHISHVINKIKQVINIYNKCKRYLFYDKFIKIMYIVTTYKTSYKSKLQQTPSMMAPQVLDSFLTKENLSGVRELKNL